MGTVVLELVVSGRSVSISLPGKGQSSAHARLAAVTIKIIATSNNCGPNRNFPIFERKTRPRTVRWAMNRQRDCLWQIRYIGQLRFYLFK